MFAYWTWPNLSAIVTPVGIYGNRLYIININFLRWIIHINFGLLNSWWRSVIYKKESVAIHAIRYPYWDKSYVVLTYRCPEEHCKTCIPKHVLLRAQPQCESAIHGNRSSAHTHGNSERVKCHLQHSDFDPRILGPVADPWTWSRWLLWIVLSFEVAGHSQSGTHNLDRCLWGWMHRGRSKLNGKVLNYHPASICFNLYSQDNA